MVNFTWEGRGWAWGWGMEEASSWASSERRAARRLPSRGTRATALRRSCRNDIAERRKEGRMDSLLLFIGVANGFCPYPIRR